LSVASFVYSFFSASFSSLAFLAAYLLLSNVEENPLRELSAEFI